MTSAMCRMDEYTMSDFKSVWHKQIELVMIIPNVMSGYAVWFVKGCSSIVIRSIPWTPSLSSMAARTIEWGL